MKTLIFIRKILAAFFKLIVLGSILASCERVLDVAGPDSKIEKSLVFADDVTATAAITGIYQEMIDMTAFSSGSNTSVTHLAGLSADEFTDFYRTDQVVLEIEDNDITIDNAMIYGLWSSAYKIIFQANSALEGIRGSSTLTAFTKAQLEGEALLIRAFTHFYLVNLFAEVPLVTTTAYDRNAVIKRTAVEDVYAQIIEDLNTAKSLMAEAYVTPGKVRPNKFAVSALLSRVYLYHKEWDLAEQEATLVIESSGAELLSDLNVVFEANSKEAIWQIMNPVPDYPTWEGYYFTISFLGPMSSVMRPELEQAFEDNDARRTNWVGEYDTGNGIVYFPFKYQSDLFSPVPVEYTTLLRFAEQYLIRAEARAMQDNLGGAIQDLDEIRGRANLPLIADINPGIQKDQLLDAIDQERRVELFTEWGHRWFDLKRRDKADAVLSILKPNWTLDDGLYPIPALELRKNPQLGDQNRGY